MTLPAEYVQIAGKNDVLIAIPSTAPLVKIGEVEDMVDYREQPAWNDVPGDRHGGPQGYPIEVQYLGHNVLVTMDLSRWVVAEIKKLRAQQERMMPLGTVDLLNMGSLMLLYNSVRLVIRSDRRAEDGTLVSGGQNYPCAFVRQPIGYGTGTKYSAVNIQFEAHRAPEGHPFHGIVFDNNVADGVAGSNPLPSPNISMLQPVYPF